MSNHRYIIRWRLKSLIQKVSEFGAGNEPDMGGRLFAENVLPHLKSSLNPVAPSVSEDSIRMFRVDFNLAYWAYTFKTKGVPA